MNEIQANNIVYKIYAKSHILIRGLTQNTQYFIIVIVIDTVKKSALTYIMMSLPNKIIRSEL